MLPDLVTAFIQGFLFVAGFIVVVSAVLALVELLRRK